MRLKTFCGCLPLKVGVILMGSLTLIWALICIIAVSVLVGHLELNYSSYIDWQFSRLIPVGIITYLLVIAATGALMIHGARKREPGFIFPWLARSTADLLLLSAGSFAYIVISPMAMDIDIYLIVLAVLFGAIALHVYIWLVIYSFYKQITVEKYNCTCCYSEEKIAKQPLNVYHHF